MPQWKIRKLGKCRMLKFCKTNYLAYLKKRKSESHNSQMKCVNLAWIANLNKQV